jgi:tetratricopeptide (TPR) repeat protein
MQPFFASRLILLVLLSLAVQAQPVPTAPADRYRVLLKMISRQQYEPAAAECRALIERHPDFSKPFSKLVFIARDTGQLPQTATYLQTLVPSNPRAWYALGLVARERKQYEEALALQQQCLEALPGFPPAVFVLAQAAVALQTPARAETFFHSRPAEPAFLYGLGILSREQRKYQQALEWQDRALQLQPRMMEPLIEKVGVLNTLGRLPEALAVCEELLSVINESEDPEQRRYWTDYKGRLHFQLSQYPQAIKDTSEALRLAREYEWRDYEERALSFLASSWFQINYFSEALQNFQQALALARQGNRRFLSRYLGNVGLVYRKLGDLTKSIDYYQQAIAAARAPGSADPESLINSLINLSELYLESGETQKSQLLLEDAQRTIGTSADTWRQYLMQAGWGRYHYYARNYRESLTFQQAALQLVRARGNPLQQGKVLNLIGDCYVELQDRPAATAAYQQALAIGQQLQVLSIIWYAEAGLARLAQDTQPQEALLHYRRAIDAIEKIRVRQTGSEEKAGYFQDATDVYQKAIALLLILHRREPAHGHGAEAFHLAERMRARTLLDSLTETTAHLEQKLEQDLLDRQQEIQQRLSQSEAQLQKAATDSKTPAATIRKLEAELLRAVNDYSDWRKQVRQRNPYLAELMLPEPLTLAQTQLTLK